MSLRKKVCVSRFEINATVSDTAHQSTHPLTHRPYPAVWAERSDDYLSAGYALGTPASDQVIYQDDHCYHDQDVNQVATEVTDKPQ
jgi:hypothetical protein